MRKLLGKSKLVIISLFLETIFDGKKDGTPADGRLLADETKEPEYGLKRSLHMNSGEASNFVKQHMLNVNFDNSCVTVEKKNGNNGGNVYKLVDLNA